MDHTLYEVERDGTIHQRAFFHASWNSGHRGFDGHVLKADDVQFIADLLAYLQVGCQDALSSDPAFPGRASSVAIDRDRIYAVGIGNGGMMAMRLACELPRTTYGFRLRGIAVIGATVGGHRYDKDRLAGALPWQVDPSLLLPEETPDVLIIHGELDADVVAIPGSAYSSSGQPSPSWIATLTTELAGNALRATQLAPWDFSFSVTRDLWFSHLQRIDPQTYDEGREELAQLFDHDVRKQGARAQVPGGARYVTTVLDPTLGHETPQGIAQIIWSWFQQPHSPGW